MSLGTSNRDGGKTSESGHLRALYKAFGSGVLSGLAVSQRGAGANMSVDIAIGDCIIGRSDATYGHPAFNDAVYNQAITAADPTNPRRDIVIMYIDYNQAPSTGVSNNTNGVVKIAVVAGTPAGSPADPSDSAINSAAGSGNPWVKLARVRVGAGVTSIGNSVIDDLRRMLLPWANGGWIYDTVYQWVYASSTTFTISGVDVTAQFPIGTKIAIYQSGAIKHFTVTAAAFSTNTTITIKGVGTANTLANAPIDRPAFSYEQNPAGFPAGSVPVHNPYKFRAFRNTSSQSVSGTAKVQLNGEDFDTNSNFDSSTNYEYTAPVDGFYHLSGAVTASVGASDVYNAYIYKNGAEELRGLGIVPYFAFDTTFPVSGLVQLSAGDKIDLRFRNGSGSAKNVINGRGATFLSGYLVSIT